MPALQPATLELSPEGVPYSGAYGDVYHSAAGALAQAQHVFLAGNDLPARWQAQPRFTIVETGFGLGNNFLATWQAWREAAPIDGRLDFISVEKHPFALADLISAHAASGAPAELAAALHRAWPPLVPGVHRLELDGGRVVLTLAFGDATEMLPRLKAQADAIFLDGFSPARNPQMWSQPIFDALAALARPGCTLATWSVSAAVRAGLAQAGFRCEKAQGFSGKREMLRGQLAARPATRLRAPRKVAIIGAGLAGTALAERLAAHGLHTVLFEAQAQMAQGASGNLAGAFRPMQDVADSTLSRLSRAGFLHAARQLDALEDAGHAVLSERCGVLQLARSEAELQEMHAAIAQQGWPADFVRKVGASEARNLTGHSAAIGGWWFPGGGWIQPASLCEANLAQAGGRAELRTGCAITRLERCSEGWQLYDAADELAAEVECVVLANAHEARRLLQADWLPLGAERGQVSHLPMAQLAPQGVVVCGQGYLTPTLGTHAVLGTSFVADDFDLTVREAEHARNLARLEALLPGSTAQLEARTLGGRTAMRAVTPDRLPLAGPLGAGYEGLWLLAGFGMHGLVWASLCAELMACELAGDPLPLERELAAALQPARFAARR